MAYEFVFPDLGEGITEGELVRWLVAEGDEVQEDQEVAEVETDKALVTIPSPHSGTVAKLHFKEGDRIPVGEVLMTFGEGESKKGDEAETEDKAKKESKEKKEEPKEKTEKESKKDKPKEETDEAEKAVESEDKPKEKSEETKKAEEKPEEKNKEEEKQSITKAEKEQEKGKEPTPISEAAKAKLPPLATPYTRRLAREQGVDLNQVKGSGPEGRITEEDVKSASGSKAKGEPSPPLPGPGAPSPETTDLEKFGPVERVPLKSIRRKISEQMLQTWHQTAMVTHIDEAEVGELMKIRKEKAEFAKKRGVKLTLLPFLMKACVIALKDHPSLNASLSEEEILLKHYYHFGFAVDTEAGLMVPVIKDVDKKSILHLASELTELSAKARERKIQVEEFQGHSFSITNIGSIGGKAFTPIIHYPDSAILGLGRTYEKAIVKDGQIEAAPILPLCLTFDHRVTDGATAARFINQIIQYLADPDLLLLEDGED